MRLKKIFYCILILVLALTATTGCKKEETELAAIELVPEHANIIGSIKLSQILNDTDLIEAYDSVEKEPGEPQTFEDALNEVVDEIGIDLRDFSEVIIFGDIYRFEQDHYLGIIAKGIFNEKQFIDRREVEAYIEFSSIDYKGYRLYTDEEGYGNAFLSKEMLIIGSTEAVKDAIDVRRGDRKQVGSTILDAYNQLGDVLIRFICEIPEDARDELLQESDTLGDTPISFEYLADLDIVGLSVNKEEETIGVYVITHFLNADSAEDAYNTLVGALLIYKGIVQDQQIKELLSEISIKRTDDSIKTAFEITLSEIEEFR